MTFFLLLNKFLLVGSKESVDLGVEVGQESLIGQHTAPFNYIIKLAHVGDTIVLASGFSRIILVQPRKQGYIVGRDPQTSNHTLN